MRILVLGDKESLIPVCSYFKEQQQAIQPFITLTAVEAMKVLSDHPNCDVAIVLAHSLNGELTPFLEQFRRSSFSISMVVLCQRPDGLVSPGAEETVFEFIRRCRAHPMYLNGVEEIMSTIRALRESKAHSTTSRSESGGRVTARTPASTNPEHASDHPTPIAFHVGGTMQSSDKILIIANAARGADLAAVLKHNKLHAVDFIAKGSQRALQGIADHPDSTVVVLVAEALQAELRGFLVGMKNRAVGTIPVVVIVNAETSPYKGNVIKKFTTWGADAVLYDTPALNGKLVTEIRRLLPGQNGHDLLSESDILPSSDQTTSPPAQDAVQTAIEPGTGTAIEQYGATAIEARLQELSAGHRLSLMTKLKTSLPEAADAAADLAMRAANEASTIAFLETFNREFMSRMSKAMEDLLQGLPHLDFIVVRETVIQQPVPVPPTVPVQAEKTAPPQARAETPGPEPRAERANRKAPSGDAAGPSQPLQKSGAELRAIFEDVPFPTGKHRLLVTRLLEADGGWKKRKELLGGELTDIQQITRLFRDIREAVIAREPELAHCVFAQRKQGHTIRFPK